jgi:hypothetical protein
MNLPINLRNSSIIMTGKEKARTRSQSYKVRGEIPNIEFITGT